MKQESKSHHVQRAIRRVLISASGAVAVAAAPQLHAQDPTIQEVVVTGSRIPQPNLTSISPVTSIGAEAVKIEGVTRVEDLINNLPQAFADFGGNLSNGSTGTATVNLRNLGPQRTLVLVNSRRLMPGETCVVTATFEPKTVGAQMASGSVTDATVVSADADVP